MKKLTLILLVLLVLTLTGCKNNRTLTGYKNNNRTQEQIDAKIATKITTFSYKGHDYLRYYHYAGNATVAGITHDPDCPCREKGGAE